jgi:predicted nuclease of restriction endonuclease-like (RecB) superfamily
MATKKKRKRPRRSSELVVWSDSDYRDVLREVTSLLEDARRFSARTVNTTMTAVYWQVGRVIVEREQAGRQRARYGEALLRRLATDLTARFGRGFSRANLEQMRRFHGIWRKSQTLSGKSGPVGKSSISQTVSGQFETPAFLLPWSHYVLLMSVDDDRARSFYETEALRGGWTVRQLKRQIDTQFHERVALSRNKAELLRKGGQPTLVDAVTPEQEIKDPLVLEFLGLKDEYSENELEEALIERLEAFLLELGGDFAFIGRQRRLRVGNAWYRVDLLFFHRVLRCLVVIDLKVGELTHADAGQMHLYLNYAREHWMREGENPPVGLILCAKKDAAVAKYALEGLANKVMAAEYRMQLPNEKQLAQELLHARREIEARSASTGRRR